MSKSNVKPAPTLQLELAKLRAAQARMRFQSSKGALQYRLKPATIATNAWEGVRDKSGEVAEGAVQAVKERPMTASGIVAGLVIFLARDPLWRLAGSLFTRRGDEDEAIIKADLENHDGNYDLTAPTVERSQTEGASA
jgi:hypothetical protein